jgi:hypothetical protein
MRTPGGPFTGCPRALTIRGRMRSSGGSRPALRKGIYDSMPISQPGSYKPVSTELMDALERTISKARLRPYLKSSGHDRERAFKLYLWNVMIGQSFHFPLQAVEISLRNSISSVFVSIYGQKWWRESTAKQFLDEWAIDELATARKRLSRKRIRPTPDEMVSRMSFGFWVATLAPQYKPKIWSKHLMAAFPYLPSGTTQQVIYARANKALELRNKIFHHEPLIDRNLLVYHSELMELLKWICPKSQLWIKAHCSIPTVARNKP